MNYNFISQLLDNGFDSDQLIALLMKNAPSLGSKIKKLLAGGWGSNEILSYVNKDPESSRINLKNAKPATPEEIAALQAYKSSRGADKSRDKQALEDLTKFTKGALKFGGTIAAPYLGGQALQAGMGAIESLMKPGNVESGPDIGQQLGQQASSPVAQAIQPSPTPPPVEPNQPPIVPNQTPQMDFGQLLDQIGIRKKVDALRERNPPDVIAKVVKYGLPKDQIRQLESQLKMPIDQIIEGYLASASPVETIQEKISKGMDISRKPEDKPDENRFRNVIEEGRKKFDENMKSQPIPEKPKNRELKLQGGESVLLPDGNLGEIEYVKKGIAKVKVGDKIRHKKLDELMESPKEAANAALELIKSFTPELQRSAHHALNTYDPITRSAQFLFHNGEGYIVEDISPEEYEKLSNEVEEAKTTGENKIGVWATGSGSRGAAYQKIVKNLKKPYRKIVVGYNLFKELQRLINEKE